MGAPLDGDEDEGSQNETEVQAMNLVSGKTTHASMWLSQEDLAAGGVGPILEQASFFLRRQILIVVWS